jgi:hypothetical protein
VPRVIQTEQDNTSLFSHEWLETMESNVRKKGAYEVADGNFKAGSATNPA